VFTREELAKLKKSQLERLGNYFGLSDLSKLRKDDLIEKIYEISSQRAVPEAQSSQDEVQMSVRIRRIKNGTDR
jgi:hypothetical protein